MIARLFRRSRTPPQRAAEPSADPSCAQQRRVLIDACIVVADQTGSEMLREVVGDALEAVGVRAVSADGEEFDPARHESVAPVPATRPDDHGRVAATERHGYLDGEELIRKPTVLVYRRDG